jgi:hypothetical protein
LLSCAVKRSVIERRLAPLLLGLWTALAPAHDLITSESAERYLTQIKHDVHVIEAKAPAAARAEANFSIGRSLNEIRELLNRDLAAHGRLQGLPTEYLVREANRLGAGFEIDPTSGRFLAITRYYEQSVKLQPNGPHAADALFGMLQGSFYDSFDTDPLTSKQTWPALRAQIAIGQALEKQAPSYPQMEEAQFILAVLYTRAARIAPDPAIAADHARRARTAASQFQARYPDSLRAAAVPLLVESLSR